MLEGAVARHMGGLSPAFWALWAGTFVNRAGTMVVPFLTLYLVDVRGVSVTSAGLVMGCFGAGSLISQFIGGALADRLGRRATVLWSTMTTSALMVLLAYVSSVGLIVVAVLLLGITINLHRPAAQAIVADILPERDHVRAYGLLFLASNLGFAAAMSAAGLMAHSGFVGIFWVDAITGAGFGLLVWRFVPEGPSEGFDSPRGHFGDVLRDRTLVLFSTWTFVYYFIYFQCDTTLPLAMRERGLGAESYGFCMAVNGILIVAAQPLIAPWLARFNPARVAGLGVAVVGLGFGLTHFASSVPSYMLTVGVWSIGEILPATVSGAIVAKLAPPHLRGRYAALSGAAWSAGWLTASAVGTHLLDVSSGLLWASCAALGLVAGIGFLGLSQRLERA